MLRFQRIVVGLDLGAHGGALTTGSELALRTARVVAREFGAQVTLVHSHAADEHWESEAGGYVFVDDDTSQDGRHALEAAHQKMSKAGVETSLVTSADKAWQAIVDQVRTQGADLIIVGKRSDSSGHGSEIGSVTQKLLHWAPCAVWAVKAGFSPVPHRIVVATDLQELGSSVLRVGGDLAARFEAEIHIVHAVQLPLSVQKEGEDAVSELVNQRRMDAQREIDAILEDAKSRLSAHVHVGITSPTRAILECVDHVRPNLVVMGTVSRSGLAGFVIGNTAERLLARLRSPILTLKPDGLADP